MNRYKFEKHHDKGKYYLVVDGKKIARIDKRAKRCWVLWPDYQYYSGDNNRTYATRRDAADLMMKKYILRIGGQNESV